MSVLLYISKSVTSLNFVTFIYFVYAYMFACICASNMLKQKCGDQRTIWGWCLVFHHVGSWEPNQIFRLGRKPAYPLDHLPDTQYYLLKLSLILAIWVKIHLNSTLLAKYCIIWAQLIKFKVSSRHIEEFLLAFLHQSLFA